MGNALPHFPQRQELLFGNHVTHRFPQQSLEEYDDREFTCEICVEPPSTSDKRFRNGDKCSHPFCTDCMVKYIRANLEGGGGSIRCPALGCGNSLDPVAWAAAVGPDLFVRWCDALCEEAIVGLERCYCPYRNCNVLIVNECAGTERKSKCPSCKRFLCFECKGIWHAGFGCEEIRDLRDPNDVAFRRLVEKNKWMRCPRFGHFVELIDGCSIVTCRCSIRFCYDCGNPYQQIQHGCTCRIIFRRPWVKFSLLAIFLFILVLSCFTYVVGEN